MARVQTEVSQGYGASPSTSVFNFLKINFFLVYRKQSEAIPDDSVYYPSTKETGIRFCTQ